nr:beta-1,6-N-acetylglucosaminyltransferase [Brevundimonas intermedia]
MIGYLILVHRYSEQFKRLFDAIYDPANQYVVHVDRNSAPSWNNRSASSWPPTPTPTSSRAGAPCGAATA